MDRTDAPPSGAFRAAVRVTLWLVGLLVAMMTGMLSAYLVLSALYFGSKAYALVRERASGRTRLLGPGDTP